MERHCYAPIAAIPSLMGSAAGAVGLVALALGISELEWPRSALLAVYATVPPVLVLLWLRRRVSKTSIESLDDRGAQIIAGLDLFRLLAPTLGCALVVAVASGLFFGTEGIADIAALYLGAAVPSLVGARLLQRWTRERSARGLVALDGGHMEIRLTPADGS